MGAIDAAAGLERAALERYLHAYLGVERFDDYCPNGLQVEGRSRVARIVTGVTASLALIDAAIADEADAVLVHHGYFWRGEDARITGQKQRRLKALLGAGINLFAYHLPLDAHLEVGNNVQLARVLGLVIEPRPAGENSLVFIGQPDAPLQLGALCQRIATRLGRTPVCVGDAAQPVTRVAWCTGAAQSAIAQAHAAGADVYISGEISEPTAHFAREMGIAYLACGHHATERYGVQALGEHLATRFALSHRFIDIDNPA